MYSWLLDLVWSSPAFQQADGKSASVSLVFFFKVLISGIQAPRAEGLCAVVRVMDLLSHSKEYWAFL